MTDFIESIMKIIIMIIKKKVNKTKKFVKPKLISRKKWCRLRKTLCVPPSSSSSYLVILISLKNLILCLCFLFTKKNQNTTTTTTERGGEIAYRITMKKEWKKNWLWFLKKKFKISTEKLLTVPLFNRMCFFPLYISLSLL